MQEFYYRRVEDGTFCLTGYEGDEAEVIIPTDKVFTILSDKVFRGHSEITAISIPDSVTDIGEFVFDGCINLRKLKLPANLRTLWGYSFVRCGIEEIVLPDHLRIIPPYAFKDCKNLRRVVCGAGLEKIYAWAFSGCDKLTEENLVNGAGAEISPQAFQAGSLTSSSGGATM